MDPNNFSAYCTVRTAYATSSVNPSELAIPTIYSLPNMMQKNILHMKAYYDHTITYPVALHIEANNCFGFLYSESGEGTITSDNKTYYVPSNSAIIFPCNGPHKIESSTCLWKITLLYLCGDDMYYYCDLYTKHNNGSLIYPVSEYSIIPKRLTEITQAKRECNLVSCLRESEMLHSFMTNLIIELLRNCCNEEPIPDYLQKMKKELDRNYSQNYTLDYFGSELKMNKFRLCREFTKYYGMSPLQYLNQLRINAACKLLIETDHHIYEIGNMVGIYNTNHFINLFKRFNGTTPTAYRDSHH